MGPLFVDCVVTMPVVVLVVVVVGHAIDVGRVEVEEGELLNGNRDMIHRMSHLRVDFT